MSYYENKMTIILFLIDTSASMNQRTCLGARPTLLDIAKDAVERFIKIRQRDSTSRFDRYMLLTFEDPPHNIKAGWKENLATFMMELKNLQALGMTTMGAALKNSLDLLNINRMQIGIDTYGQGRCPYYLEPSIIIVITDGSKLSTKNAVQEELNLPMHSTVPGNELTKEPFRWDQRLFSLVLRFTGIPPNERDPISVVPPDNSPIDAMCEVTGGRSYAIISHRMLIQCLESIAQKLVGGVVINFEKIGPDPTPLVNDDGIFEEKNDCPSPSLNNSTNNNNNNTSWHNCRKSIYVARNAQKGYTVGFWPIPESFWPDMGSPALPPRSAHPVVKFNCTNSEPMVIDNLPFDKYELEPSPLTQYILSRKQSTIAWQVFVSNSYKNSEVEHPFGYLKASTSLTCVNLFVMPYNYPVILPLLDELFKVHRCKPTREWKQQFENYLKNTPLYYSTPLKRAFVRMGGPSLIPDSMENCLSYSVLNYLKRLKNQAKTEYEKLIASVGTKKPTSDAILVNSQPDTPGVNGMRPFWQCLKVTDPSSPSNRIANDRLSIAKSEVNEFTMFALHIKDKEVKNECYRNAFDIPRRGLLDQLARMRSNFLQCNLNHTRFQHEDQLHSLPVAQMGNYQEYLKRVTPPLREIESIPMRQHMFGNPFKIDKRMMVDEADIDLVGGGGSPMRGQKRMMDFPVSMPKSKRKPGPLPKDFLWRPQSPSPILREFPPLSDVPVLTLNSPLERDDDLFMEQKDRPCPSLTPVEDLTFSWNSLPETPITNHISQHPTMNHVDEWNTNHEIHNLMIPLPQTLESNNGVNCVNGNGYRTEFLHVRRELFKEVRKPGRNFTHLFQQLRLVENIATQTLMVQELISEAHRFKRKFLIKMLEDFKQTLLLNNEAPFSELPLYSR